MPENPQEQSLPPGIASVGAPPATPNLPPGIASVGAPVDDVAARHARSRTGQENYGTNEGESGLTGVVTGIGKEAASTMVGGAKIANKVLPDALQIPITSNNLKTRGFAEGAGAFVENAAEFLAGDEAFKALAEASNAVKYIKTASGWTRWLAQHPISAKALEAGGRIARYSAVGGVQGGVKGAAEGNAIEGAKAGAEGGALGGGFGEGLNLGGVPIVRQIAKALGVNRAPVEEFIKAARPGKWDTDFTKDFVVSAERLAKEVKSNPPKDLKGLANNALEAMKNLWNTDIHNVIDAHKTNFQTTTKIADDLRNESMANAARTTHTPDGVKNFQVAADKWEKLGGLPIGEIEKHLEHINSMLLEGKWWDKTAAERAAEFKVGTKTAVNAEEARLLRETLYDHLENTAVGPNDPANEIRNFKQQYGALANIEHTLRGTANVIDRQVPFSLKEMVGLTGAAAAGPKGWMLAAVPYIDKYVNNPARMGVRAVLNQTGNVSTGAKVTQGVLDTLGQAGKTGATIGAASANTPEDTSSWVPVTNNQGESQLVHPDDLPKAQEGGFVSQVHLASEENFDSIGNFYADKYKVPEPLVAAVMDRESLKNPDAISKKGAAGLMQLKPSTAKAYGVTDILDPHQNIEAGVHYLSDLLTKYKGSLPLALAAYNAGPTAVAKYGGVPPYKETRAYIRQVMRKMSKVEE